MINLPVETITSTRFICHSTGCMRRTANILLSVIPAISMSVPRNPYSSSDHLTNSGTPISSTAGNIKHNFEY